MPPVATPASDTRARSGLPDGAGFWAVGFAFVIAMGFTTIPTPLYGLYQERDGYSSLTITVIFATYAVGVILSLFFAGHLSDWYGRRRVLVAALVVSAVAGVVFVFQPELPGLLVARLLSGLGAGAAAATATAWLAELHARQRPDASSRRAQIVAASANLGGLGFGALVSGMLAEWVGHPLVVPYLVFDAALLVSIGLVLLTAETRQPPDPRPRYRPQRVSVPHESRARYFAAALGALISFAAFALFGALTSLFLAGPLHNTSHALAGAAVFAVFSVAVVGQSVTATWGVRELLAAGMATMVAGLALAVTAVWLPAPSLVVFLAGGVVIGAGSGLIFKGAVGTVIELATDENRAEALAGLFLAGYIGLTIPVVGLGLLTQEVSARLALLVFALVLAVGTAVAAPTLLGRRERVA
jgi:MFS family permease